MWHNFPFAWGTSFNISYSVGQLGMNSFSSFMSENNHFFFIFERYLCSVKNFRLTVISVSTLKILI